MSVIAVFSAKTYCLYGCETWRMSSSDKHKLKVAWNNCFRKFFNACWRESAKPLLFYCGTMPGVGDALLLPFCWRCVCVVCAWQKERSKSIF